MITYEQAKQLKDAGFPQEYRKTDIAMDFAYDNNGKLHMMHDDNDTDWWLGQGYDFRPKGKENELLIKCPTLEELIDALGKSLLQVIQVHPEIQKSFPDYNWIAYGGSKTGPKQAGGKTLEEALFKLWLILNNK